MIMKDIMDDIINNLERDDNKALDEITINKAIRDISMSERCCFYNDFRYVVDKHKDEIIALGIEPNYFLRLLNSYGKPSTKLILCNKQSNLLRNKCFINQTLSDYCAAIIDNPQYNPYDDRHGKVSHERCKYALCIAPYSPEINDENIARYGGVIITEMYIRFYNGFKPFIKRGKGRPFHSEYDRERYNKAERDGKPYIEGLMMDYHSTMADLRKYMKSIGEDFLL